MKKFFKEFKTFIEKGNAFDLAIGVVVGGAFSTIVTSLVNDIIMPVIGLIIGGYDFSSLVIKFKSAEIRYGLFIQNVINFLIISLCIFIVIRFINKFKEKLEKREEKKKEEVSKSDEVILLEEIKNLLKKKK